MGLREKLTLVLITIVFYKTVCLCVPQTKNANPLEKYLNNSKRKMSSKYETASRPSNQRFEKENYKTYVSEFNYPKTPGKVPNTKYDRSGKTSSIDVFSESAYLDNLRKEKRMNRRKKQTDKIYNKDDLPLSTISDSFRNHEPSSYFNEIGQFPEVQYPLTALETWTPSYWNLLPAKKEYSEFKINDFINPSKKQTNMNLEKILQSSKKGSKGILKAKDEIFKINDAKNVTDTIKNEGFNKTTLGKKQEPTALRALVKNKTLTLNQPQQRDKSKIQSKELTQPATIKNKLNTIKTIITTSQFLSNQNQNTTEKVTVKSPRSRSKKLPKVAQSNNQSNNIICASNNLTIPCINFTSLNDINLGSEIQNMELLNDVQVLSELENNTDKLTKKEIVKNSDISVPLLIDTISSVAFLEDIFDSDLPKVTLVGNDLASFMLGSSEDEFSEKTTETLFNNSIGEVVDDKSSSSKTTLNSTKRDLLLGDLDTDPPIQAFTNPTNGLSYFHRHEVDSEDSAGSFTDGSVRSRILEVLATDNQTVSSLKESILNIILTENQVPIELISELNLSSKNDIDQHRRLTSTDNTKTFDKILNHHNSQSTISLPSDDEFEIPLTVTPINLYENTVNKIITNDIKESIPETSLSNRQIYDLSQSSSGPAIDDNSTEKPFEPSAIDILRDFNLISINPEVISKASIEDDLTVSQESINVILEPIVTEALADNLREIISNPSNSRALVDDLREIIRLLMIWNSQIDDINKLAISSTTNKSGKLSENSGNSLNVLKNMVGSSDTLFEKPTVDYRTLCSECETDFVEPIIEICSGSKYKNNITFAENSTICPYQNNQYFKMNSTKMALSEKLLSYSSEIVSEPAQHNNNDKLAKESMTIPSEIHPDAADSNTKIPKKHTNGSERAVFETEDNNIDSHEMVSDITYNDTNAIFKNSTIYYSKMLPKTSSDNNTTITDQFINERDSHSVVFTESTSDASLIVPIDTKPSKINIILDNMFNGSSQLPSNDTIGFNSSEVSLQIIFDTSTEEIGNVSKNINSDIYLEKDSDLNKFVFPIPLDSTYTSLSPYNETLYSTQNETNMPPSQTNIFLENYVMTGPGNSFGNVCRITDDTSYKNQCYISEEPTDFNSTSNLTEQITVSELDSIDKLSNLSDISLKNVVTGYISNYTSDETVASSSITNTDDLLFNEQIPDYSDYTLSPELDANTDFIDNTFSTDEQYDDYSETLSLFNNTDFIPFEEPLYTAALHTGIPLNFTNTDSSIELDVTTKSLDDVQPLSAFILKEHALSIENSTSNHGEPSSSSEIEIISNHPYDNILPEDVLTETLPKNESSRNVTDLILPNSSTIIADINMYGELDSIKSNEYTLALDDIDSGFVNNNENDTSDQLILHVTPIEVATDPYLNELPNDSVEYNSNSVKSDVKATAITYEVVEFTKFIEHTPNLEKTSINTVLNFSEPVDKVLDELDANTTNVANAPAVELILHSLSDIGMPNDILNNKTLIESSSDDNATILDGFDNGLHIQRLSENSNIVTLETNQTHVEPTDIIQHSSR